VRVRILKALSGVIEGHPLSQYVPGHIYEVTDALGLQLAEMGAAIEVRSTDPIDDIDLPRLTGGVRVVPPDTAKDRPERRRRKRR